MFNKSQEELSALGASITTSEIKRQPHLWEGCLGIYDESEAQIKAFLEKARELGGSRRTHIVFTGAGTSAYVGDTLTPYLRHRGDNADFVFQALPTTDIVSAPLDFLRPDDPTMLVSFARSGNSPESLAAVERASAVVKDLLYLNITCAPEGALAHRFTGDDSSLTLLIPDANDQGFAMTGSYSCMLLMALLIFDTAPKSQKLAWIHQAAQMGRMVVEHEDRIFSWLSTDINRITYLGSGSLGAMAREAQLKILELTAGKIATSFDTSMGYRHGPKSFVDGKTLVIDFVSNDNYTRQYDLDILNEISSDSITQHIVAIQQDAEPLFAGTNFTFPGDTLLPEAYAALPFMMVAQTLALNMSVLVGNTPDTPSPSGTVNRVVKGVVIHPFEL
jgi:tagatose-6-phosphate ketose/aldose isomerase